MSAKNHNFASDYPKSLNPEVRMLREHPKLLASQHVHSCLQHRLDRRKLPYPTPQLADGKRMRE